MKNYKTIIFLFLILAFSWSCRPSRPEFKPITTQEIEAHIRFLSDDLLEGRAVGSRGLAIAALYQENFFRSIGLEPVFGERFRQAFVLKGSEPDKNASLEVFSDEVRIEYEIYDDFVVNSHGADCPEGVEGELVYCGYLIQAPERDWDDIKGADLKGKVLLVEVNEPGNSPEGIFDVEDMTYYGRWTYKFEKASEIGATGIIIIHNTKGASYGWEVVRNSLGYGQKNFFMNNSGILAFY